VGDAKRGKRKEIKACSKAWFGHMQVQEKKERRER
jgi:hypothetical protein